ncbi:MAG TPA: hypothetical protein VGN55_08425 [Xanthobacteraceae bacterium]|jgi:hypothetical protein
MQDALRHRLDERLASPRAFPDGRFSGRGIVTCAGGPRYFTCVWVLIWVLRYVHRTSLPIQVWHLGVAEMSAGMRALLEEEGVEVINAETVIGRHPARVCGGWPLKPYAIMHSRFQEVLYLDADTIPFSDPVAVFGWEIYRAAGLLLWPDVLDLKAENPIWEKVGLAPRACISVESGVLAVDKARAWSVLDIAVLLNEHWEELYSLIYGDKDSFLLSCRLLAYPEAMIAHRPFNLDDDLVQRDPQGEPFLHHRTCSKWNLSGRNRPVTVAALDEGCAQALAELRRRWTGVVFNAPPASPAARAAEAAVIATRTFEYTTSGGPGRRLELLSGNRVAQGRGECEQHWAVAERDGNLILQLFSDVQLRVELTRLDDGSWRGGSAVPPPFDARLVSVAAAASWPHHGAKCIVRSAADTVAALLDPSLQGAGYDEDTARELAAALSLLNSLFDDVAEQITGRLAAHALDAKWSEFLAGLARTLAQSRDRRIALSGERAIHPPGIDPALYVRAV